jgi:hypothetical protein
LIGTGINNNANSAFGNIKAKATMIPYMAPEAPTTVPISANEILQILDYLNRNYLITAFSIQYSKYLSLRKALLYQSLHSILKIIIILMDQYSS